MNVDAKTPKFASVIELMPILDLSETAIRNHVRRSGIKQNKDGKYNVQKMIEIVLKHRQDDPKNGYEPTSVAGRVRSKKMLIECKILEEKLAQIKRESIPFSEHRSILLRHMALVKRTIEHSPKDLAALCSDVALVRAWEEKVNALLITLSEECEAAAI